MLQIMPVQLLRKTFTLHLLLLSVLVLSELILLSYLEFRVRPVNGILRMFGIISFSLLKLRKGRRKQLREQFSLSTHWSMVHAHSFVALKMCKCLSFYANIVNYNKACKIKKKWSTFGGSLVEFSGGDYGQMHPSCRK